MVCSYPYLVSFFQKSELSLGMLKHLYTFGIFACILSLSSFWKGIESVASYATMFTILMLASPLVLSMFLFPLVDFTCYFSTHSLCHVGLVG